MSFDVYWCSMEAKKLFQVMDSEEDALEVIDNQMHVFISVTQDAKGYWNVIAGLESNDDLTTYQKWII
jgi:hypothetical protein